MCLLGVARRRQAAPDGVVLAESPKDKFRVVKVLSAQAFVVYRACYGGRLQQLLGGVEFSVLAGVVQRDIRVGALLALVNFASVERFRIHVNAYRALVKFLQSRKTESPLPRRNPVRNPTSA